MAERFAAEGMKVVLADVERPALVGGVVTTHVTVAFSEALRMELAAIGARVGHAA
jgi:hypothetical protein